jgi:hypothetical protein
MKKTTKLITTAVSCIALFCAFSETPPNVERPRAQITFVVKDDFGKPVRNVDVTMSTFHHWVPSSGFGKDIRERYKSKTDDNGKAILSGESLKGEFTYGAYAQSGYYYNGRLAHRFVEKKNGRWEPWNPTIEIIYKPILNPIPYIGGESYEIVIPKKEEPIGFDFFINDWVPPYGKGQQSDIFFTLIEKTRYVSVYAPHDSRLLITFPNKGDGIQSCFAPVLNAGDMPMPRYAPESAYEDKLELKSGRDEKGFIKLRNDQNYFFRIRTELDAKGKVQKAYYGKIIGNILFWHHRRMELKYELNPNPNDINMEFDKTKNLLKQKR